MALSPMMKQYMAIKENYKDCLLFYRLGDFYELFFEDAVIASKELDLTLTGRDCGLDERAPMCGVPYHSVDTYIAKLIDKDYKVAICEQMTLPEESKGIVEREVTRIITPGTVTEPNMLNDQKNNYLACVYYDNNELGVAWADITTGEFYIAQYNDNIQYNLAAIMSKISPSEIICNLEAGNLHYDNLITSLNLPSFKVYSPDNLDISVERKKVLLLISGGQAGEAATNSGALLMSYVTATQKRVLSHIIKIHNTTTDKILIIDSAARKNLELTETIRERKKHGSLLGVIDKTKTSMGSRMLRKWLESPLQSKAEIDLRLDAVEEMVEFPLLRQSITEALKKINDIERIVGKISYGSVNPRDCLGLAQSLKYSQELLGLLAGCHSVFLNKIDVNIGELKEIEQLLLNAICDNPPVLLKDGGFIRDGYNAELDQLRNIGSHGKEMLAALEAEERESTGIKGLKIGFNKVFGYYIEVTKSQMHLVPYRYQRKQTIVGGERFITPELKQLEDKILGSAEKAIKLEQILFNDLREKLLKYILVLQRLSVIIAKADCINSLAMVAVDYNYVRPQINDKSSSINIKEGRHPVIERFIKNGGFVPNDTLLDCEQNGTLIITGPNMAGKSTYMRQVALITIMAHMGSFVPAKSAEICIVDKIFTRIGASDDLSSGQSTFMVEMNEMSNILQNATKDSLLILDEIGRGTSTLDGLSIAWAIMEHISNNLKAKTLFATHFHELTELENTLPGVKNYRVAVREMNNTIVFLHKIVRGGAHKSFGIEVAALAGIPHETIARAKAILSLLEQEHSGRERRVSKNDIQTRRLSETEEIIAGLDINSMTPLNAFEVLADLKSRIKKDA